jgi:hypothetical protein
MKRRKIDSYIQLICYDLCQHKSEVLGKGRRRSLVDCRRIICLICLEKGFTKKELIEVLNRDRTTIDHLINSGHTLVETYPLFRARFVSIQTKLK